MPAFDVQVTGASFIPWVDPAGSSQPSRLNDSKLHVAGAWQVQSPGTLIVTANVGGLVLADGDARLNGNVFLPVLSEFSGLPPPQVTQPTAGYSAIVHVALLAIHAGHHVLLITLGGAAVGGGGLLVPFDVL